VGVAVRRKPRPAGWHFDQKEPVIHEDGRRGCRWCKGPVKPPARAWCSPQCIHAWTFRTRNSVFRQTIFDRDKGVCYRCGLDTTRYDTEAILAQLTVCEVWHLKDERQRKNLRPRPVLGRNGLPLSREHWLKMLGEAYEWKRRHKIPPGTSPWDVDHIVPVSAGGSWFSSDNVSLICKPCHQKKTLQENKERVLKRRGSRGNG
jgi:5-methylcytosine-specific restriction endonuclease McrA